MSNNDINLQHINVKFEEGNEEKVIQMFEDEFVNNGVIIYSDETTLEFQIFDDDEHVEFFKELKKVVSKINFLEFSALGTGFFWEKGEGDES